MNSHFKPYRVLLKMLSPVVMTAFPPSLDGVLFEGVRQRNPDEDDEKIREKLKRVLAFNERLGVFHASSMRFGVTRAQGVTVSDYRRSDFLHEGKRSSSMFLPNGKNRYKDIVVMGGPTKKRMTVRPAYSAPYCVFEVLGDANKIKGLLCNTFLGIGYDAQNSGMGAFDVERIEISEIDEDISLFEGGAAKRPLPLGAADGVEALSALMPPYYATTQKICSLPERVVLLNVELI